MNLESCSPRAATGWRSILRVERLDDAALASGADALLVDSPVLPDTRPDVGRSALVLRVDALDDLDRAMTVRPDALLLAECGSGAELQIFSARLAAAEAIAGLPDMSIPVIAAIETPEALLALDTFPRATRRLTGLVFDGKPLARRMCAASLADASGKLIEPLRVARTLVLAAAASAGVPAFEVDRGNRKNEDPRASGFAGMVTRDPSLVAAINAAFSGGR